MKFQKDDELRKFEEAKVDCGAKIASLRDGAVRGSGRDKYILALCHGHGLGIPRNLDAAKKALTEAIACRDVLSGHAAMVMELIFQRGYFPTPWSYYPYSNHSSRACEQPVDLSVAKAFFKKADELHVYSDLQINEIEAAEGCADVIEVGDDCDLLALGAKAGNGVAATKAALSCACAQGAEMAQAERECAVKAVRDMMNAGTYKAVDLCQCRMGGSGSLTMMCSANELENAKRAFSGFFDKLESDLFGDTSGAGKKLREAANKFVQASVAWKQYSEGWAGSGANSRYVAVESSQYIKVATDGQKRLERLVASQESAPGLEAADRMLNEGYQLCRSYLAGKGPGPDGAKLSQPQSEAALQYFKDWERKWIAYRGAWVDLGVTYARVKNLKGSEVTKLREGLARELTEEQTGALRSSCGNDGQ